MEFANNNACIAEKDIPSLVRRPKSTVKKWIKQGKINPVGIENGETYYYRGQVMQAAY